MLTQYCLRLINFANKKLAFIKNDILLQTSVFPIFLPVRLQTQLLRRCDRLPGQKTAWNQSRNPTAPNLGWESTPHLLLQSQAIGSLRKSHERHQSLVRHAHFRKVLQLPQQGIHVHQVFQIHVIYYNPKNMAAQVRSQKDITHRIAISCHIQLSKIHGVNIV